MLWVLMVYMIIQFLVRILDVFQGNFVGEIKSYLETNYTNRICRQDSF